MLTRRSGETVACGPAAAARSTAHAALAVPLLVGGLIGLLAGGLLGSLAAPPAQAQTQPPAVTPQAQPASPPIPDQVFGDWIQRCTTEPPPGASPPPAGKQNACFLIQQVMDQNTQRPLMKVTIGYFGQERQAGAVIAMPLGVPLAHGVHMSVDGSELGAVPFQVCRRDGCQAFFRLEDPTIAAFKAGSTAQARVESTQGEGFNLPISLKGFTAGFGAIQ